MDKLLRESGIAFEKVNYYFAPLGEKKLGELIRKMGIKPRELLRTNRYWRDRQLRHTLNS